MGGMCNLKNTTALPRAVFFGKPMNTEERLIIPKHKLVVPATYLVGKLDMKLEREEKQMSALGHLLAWTLPAIPPLMWKEYGDFVEVGDRSYVKNLEEVIGRTDEALNALEIPDHTTDPEGTKLFIGGVFNSLIQGLAEDPTHFLFFDRLNNRSKLSLMAAGALGIFAAHEIDALPMNGQRLRVKDIIEKNDTSYSILKPFVSVAKKHKEKLGIKIAEVTGRKLVSLEPSRLLPTDLSLSGKQSQ